MDNRFIKQKNKSEQQQFETLERAKEAFFQTPGVDIDIYGTYQGLDGLKYVSLQQDNDDSLGWRLGNRSVSSDGTLSQMEEGGLTWFDSKEPDVTADKRRRDFRDVEGNIMGILHGQNSHGDNNFLIFSGRTKEGSFAEGQENVYVGIVAPVMDPAREGFKVCTVSFPVESEALRMYASLSNDDKKSFILDMWHGSANNDEYLQGMKMQEPEMNSTDSITIGHPSFDLANWEEIIQ